MKFDKIVSTIKEGKPVLVKNLPTSNTLAELIIYYIEEEPNSEFSKRYKEEVGKDFDYQKALPLYLKYIKGLDCEFKFDRFYTKIIPK